MSFDHSSLLEFVAWRMEKREQWQSDALPIQLIEILFSWRYKEYKSETIEKND